MFDKYQLEKVVDLQRKSYNLLLWLQSGIERKFITFSKAHEFLNFSDAAKAWIEEHRLNLPENARPEIADLDAFCNIFTSYLTTSFELVENPGKQTKTDCGCTCPLCLYIGNAPNLKTRKLSAKDKKRVKILKVNYLSELAFAEKIPADLKKIDKLASNEDIREPLALATYGWQLTKRANGYASGPVLLVLWREFAWEKTGSPKRDFSLNVKDILAAETKLLKLLHD